MHSIYKCSISTVCRYVGLWFIKLITRVLFNYTPAIITVLNCQEDEQTRKVTRHGIRKIITEHDSPV